MLNTMFEEPIVRLSGAKKCIQNWVSEKNVLMQLIMNNRTWLTLLMIIVKSSKPKQIANNGK